MCSLINNRPALGCWGHSSPNKSWDDELLMEPIFLIICDLIWLPSQCLRACNETQWPVNPFFGFAVVGKVLLFGDVSKYWLTPFVAEPCLSPIQKFHRTHRNCLRKRQISWGMSFCGGFGHLFHRNFCELKGNGQKPIKRNIQLGWIYLIYLFDGIFSRKYKNDIQE